MKLSGTWMKLPHIHLPKFRYFIPHHCVLKPDSQTTKLRVVFDASAVTSSGKSLNDLMHKGPTVQNSLMSILLRLRMHKYVFTADIEKMYRQIWINPNDQQYQMIVWRNDPSERLKFYRLKTFTYGTKSAPYLATKCLEYLASKNMQKYPIGSSALKMIFTSTTVSPELNQFQRPFKFKKSLITYY